MRHRSQTGGNYKHERLILTESDDERLEMKHQHIISQLQFLIPGFEGLFPVYSKASGGIRVRIEPASAAGAPQALEMKSNIAAGGNEGVKQDESRKHGWEHQTDYNNSRIFKSFSVHISEKSQIQ